jgi:hypothetical protein
LLIFLKSILSILVVANLTETEQKGKFEPVLSIF